MPASTYELISTTTLSSNTSTVTLDSIPATYTDLVIVGNYKVVNGGGVGFSLRFNGDTGNNYEWMGYYANGSAHNANYAQPYSMIYLSIALNTDFTTTVAHVQNYATTGTYRPILCHSGNISYNSAYAGSWNNTIDAITAINLVCDGGSNILSGSKFSLYGILKA